MGGGPGSSVNLLLSSCCPLCVSFPHFLPFALVLWVRRSEGLLQACKPTRRNFLVCALQAPLSLLPFSLSFPCPLSPAGGLEFAAEPSSIFENTIFKPKQCCLSFPCLPSFVFEGLVKAPPLPSSSLPVVVITNTPHQKKRGRDNRTSPLYSLGSPHKHEEGACMCTHVFCAFVCSPCHVPFLLFSIALQVIRCLRWSFLKTWYAYFSCLPCSLFITPASASSSPPSGAKMGNRDHGGAGSTTTSGFRVQPKTSPSPRKIHMPPFPCLLLCTH